MLNLLWYLGSTDRLLDEILCRPLPQCWERGLLLLQGIHENWTFFMHSLLFVGSQHELLQLLSHGLPYLALTMKTTTMLLQLAARATPSRIPLSSPTTNGEPCPHLALCKNCGKPHAANSPCCQFWQHHFNHFWVLERYVKTDDLWSHAHPLTGETGTRCKAMAPRDHSGDGGEA